MRQFFFGIKMAELNREVKRCGLQIDIRANAEPVPVSYDGIPLEFNVSFRHPLSLLKPLYQAFIAIWFMYK